MPAATKLLGAENRKNVPAMTPVAARLHRISQPASVKSSAAAPMNVPVAAKQAQHECATDAAAALAVKLSMTGAVHAKPPVTAAPLIRVRRVIVIAPVCAPPYASAYGNWTRESNAIDKRLSTPAQKAIDRHESHKD
jgi:hypothetical protein